MTRFIMTWCLAVGGAAGAEELAVKDAAIEPSNAVSLRFGGGMSVAFGGLGVIAPVETTVSYERSLGHLSLVLGATVLGNNSPQSQSLMVGVEPGLRWTFGARRLSGPWVGFAVPLSASSSRSTLQGIDNVTPFTATGFSASADALIGWSFQFDNGLFVQLAGGPRVAVIRTVWTGGEQGSVSAGVRAFLGVGAAF